MGTLVNGTRVRDGIRLRLGDIIGIGSVQPEEGGTECTAAVELKLATDGLEAEGSAVDARFSTSWLSGSEEVFTLRQGESNMQPSKVVGSGGGDLQVSFNVSPDSPHFGRGAHAPPSMQHDQVPPCQSQLENPARCERPPIDNLDESIATNEDTHCSGPVGQLPQTGGPGSQESWMLGPGALRYQGPTANRDRSPGPKPCNLGLPTRERLLP